MHEAHRGLASPSYDSEHSGSKRLRARDLYHGGSDEKYGSPGSDLRYDRIKESENEISGHIDRASKFQNERLAEELKTNAYYKRELDALRSNLHSTGSKVKSNHFPEDDEDYLIKSTKERIKRLQEQRERELGYQFEEGSAEKAKIRVRQSHREEELYKDLYPREDEGARSSNRFKESITSNKTYELSQSAKSPSAQYKERITGGLRALEDKMDVMEKELDQHLNHKNVEYFTNRELIEQKQKHRERELMKEKELNEEAHTTEEDEDDERMRSMKEKGDHLNRSSGKKQRDANFKNAFSKREERLKQENEKDTERRAQAEEDEASPEEEEEEIDEEEEARIREDHRQRMIEEELESLKEENRRIRNELTGMKHTQEIERRYGEPQVHAADMFPYEEYEKSGKLKKTTVLRGSKKLNSDKALGSLKYEDKIKETINAARNNVHEKMKTNNKTQGSKSLNRKKLASDFEKEPQFLGLRNELYQKYYGHPTHLKEATILLNKGIPTSYMSDSRREVDTKDPKKTLPKRYEKTLRR